VEGVVDARIIEPLDRNARILQRLHEVRRSDLLVTFDPHADLAFLCVGLGLFRIDTLDLARGLLRLLRGIFVEFREEYDGETGRVALVSVGRLSLVDLVGDLSQIDVFVAFRDGSRGIVTLGRIDLSRFQAALTERGAKFTCATGSERARHVERHLLALRSQHDNAPRSGQCHCEKLLHDATPLCE